MLRRAGSLKIILPENGLDEWVADGWLPGSPCLSCVALCEAGSVSRRSIREGGRLLGLYHTFAVQQGLRTC
jgi:hypothetical protein